jgi:DNA-directed RNA polymerase specialized sigma24 family protein
MVIKSTGFTDKDSKVVMLFQKGDKKAFELLYDQFAPVLFSVISRIVKDGKIAELALSKAFMQIWQNRKSYCTQKGCIIVWLLQFARNAAFSLSEKRNSDNLVNFHTGSKENCSLELLDLMLIYGKTPVEVCQLLNISQDVFAAKLKSAIQISHTKI